jgi:hypothetical protein
MLSEYAASKYLGKCTTYLFQRRIMRRKIPPYITSRSRRYYKIADLDEFKKLLDFRESAITEEPASLYLGKGAEYLRYRRNHNLDMPLYTKIDCTFYYKIEDLDKWKAKE